MHLSPHKYGRLRPQFPAGLKDITHYAKLDAPPVSVAVPSVQSWPMDGNARIGDCTMAAAAHALQAWNTITAQNDQVPSKEEIESEYFELTGGKDTGLVISAVLKTWNTTGLWSNKVLAYAPFSKSDDTLMEQVVDTFGLAYVGVEIPESAETQFAAGEPWTVAITQTQILGGHCVPVVGYDADWLYVVTWAKVQKVERAWFSKYGEEAWAIVSEQAQQAGGLRGVDLAQLQADLASV